jgi:RimJ/RimL family protein N-acetyltransferase
MLVLEKIIKSDFNNILEITSNPEVMKYIGNSRIWDKDKVAKFIQYCIKDEKESNRIRSQYYYKILNDNREFVGIIGFHKFLRKELSDLKTEFFLTIYFNPKQQGKGYYSETMNLLLDEMRKQQPRKRNLYSLVRQSNIKMNEISKAKYKFVKSVKLGDEKLNLYAIPIIKKLQTGGNSKKTKKKLNQKLNQKSDKHFYLTASKNIPADRIDKLFTKRGNWVKYVPRNQKKSRIKTKEPRIDFIYIDHQDNIYNKPLQQIPSFIKNFIDDDKHKVGRKNELYTNLGQKLKENPNLSLKNYLLEQHSFDWGKSFKEGKQRIEEEIERIRKLFNKYPNKVWIYKPVAGFRGMNIRIFNSDNFDEFNSYIRDFIKTYSPVWMDPKNKSRMAAQSQWVLQEYITKPLLYKNKKMHIRPIFLYHKKGNQKIGYILDRILVAHSIEDYKFGDFENDKIHDTHFSKTTSGRIYFQDDFVKEKILTKEQVKNIEEQVRDLGKYVFDLINSRCYPENKVCYETFGMDIMIDSETMKIKLLEVQITNISYGFFDDDKIPGFSNMFEYVLENSMETVVDQYFPPKNKIEKHNGFIPFYTGTIHQ